ncbi:MAG: hypothetical protein E7637_03865 [Ruminococcaceae bacterium]|nr:hypothetical protein [Oscillospiraceae bacterium]
MQTTPRKHTSCKLPLSLQELLSAPICEAIRECGAPRVEEIRLFSRRYATVSCESKNYRTNLLLDEQAIREILLRMCKGSLYAYSQTIHQGYLSLSGGIRVGVCGTAATEENRIIGVSSISGLMIRIPRRVFADASPIVKRLSADRTGGMLIYAPPTVGKTTLLRSVAALAASSEFGFRTVVVDTRSELKYTLDDTELNLYVLDGYPRNVGIEIAVRSLGAQLVICDEIGSDEDARSILELANCGVPLVASTHGLKLDLLLKRPAFSRLHSAKIFHTYVGLSRQSDRFLYHFTSHGEISV